jgi:hypothetical protein
MHLAPKAFGPVRIRGAGRQKVERESVSAWRISDGFFLKIAHQILK